MKSAERLCGSRPDRSQLALPQRPQVESHMFEPAQKSLHAVGAGEDQPIESPQVLQRTLDRPPVSRFLDVDHRFDVRDSAFLLEPDG